MARLSSISASAPAWSPAYQRITASAWSAAAWPGPNPASVAIPRASSVDVLGGRQVVLRPGRHAEHLERPARSPEVAESLVDLERLVRIAERLRAGSPDRIVSAARPTSAWARSALGGVGRSSARPSQRRPSAREPCHSHDCHMLAARRRASTGSRGQAPVERCPQVVVLELEPGEGRLPRVARECGLGPGSEPQRPSGVGGLDRTSLADARQVDHGRTRGPSRAAGSAAPRPRRRA